MYHWENYTEAIEVSNFWVATKNSLIVTVCSVVILMVICSMASYVIARNQKSKVYQSLYYVFLAAMDFHTSPLIPDMGEKFNGAQFAHTLKDAHGQRNLLCQMPPRNVILRFQKVPGKDTSQPDE